MTAYAGPIEDIKFVTEGVLDIDSHDKRYPSYQEATPDLVEMILCEYAKLSETELAALVTSPCPVSGR